MKKSVLAICDTFSKEGFDIQSDVRTIEAYGYEPVKVITNDRAHIFTLDQVLKNAMSSRAEVCKIGLITSNLACDALVNFLGSNPGMMAVIRPSLISKHGDLCVTEDVYNNIANNLLPHATVLFLNSYEAELLSGTEILSDSDALNSAKTIATRFRCAVYVSSKKGTNFYDFLVNGNSTLRVPNYKRNENFVRADFSFAAACACELYDASSLEVASKNAKKFITGNSDKCPVKVVEEQEAVEEVKPEIKKESSLFSFSIPKAGERTGSILGLEKYMDSKSFTSTSVKETSVVGRSETVTGPDGSLRSTTVKSSIVGEAVKTTAPSKEVSVVAEVDNFSSESEIDAAFNRSIQALREKLNRLK